MNLFILFLSETFLSINTQSKSFLLARYFVNIVFIIKQMFNPGQKNYSDCWPFN